MTIATIVALIIAATGILILEYDPNQAEASKKNQIAVQKYVTPPELQTKIQFAKTLLTQDNLEKSMSMVESLLGEFPYEGQLYMIKGDILMRHQQPIAAMYEYKEAISLNPDFLDKKTKLFQGKKIKVTVEEAMASIVSGLQENPGNNQLKDDRQVVYFMKRKLAGSCG